MQKRMFCMKFTKSESHRRCLLRLFEQDPPSMYYDTIIWTSCRDLCVHCDLRCQAFRPPPPATNET